MDLLLKNKRVLVTGSTTGIGYQIARQFAKEGSHVFIAGRNRKKAEEVALSIAANGGSADFVIGDISGENGIQEIIRQINENGGIDILVNNAGIYINHDWFTALPNDWLSLYKINVVSSVHLAKAFIPQMKAKGWGRIIQISSGEATQPFAFMPDYAATKAAMNNLTVSLSKALTSTGITVNTVSPGIIVTEGLRDFYMNYGIENGWGSDWKLIEKKILETILNNNVGRLGTPDDVANLVCFLASPLSGYINGANYRVDGGSTVSVN
jgi:3-oxoacyl-[acyl-carrier protein] reductase